jgi:hypothetical protein
VATALKLLPVMVTAVPAGPEAGEKEVMAGWEKRDSEQKNATLNSILFFTPPSFMRMDVAG